MVRRRAIQDPYHGELRAGKANLSWQPGTIIRKRDATTALIATRREKARGANQACNVPLACWRSGEEDHSAVAGRAQQ
jgi:hypothetical protein